MRVQNISNPNQAKNKLNFKATPEELKVLLKSYESLLKDIDFEKGKDAYVSQLLPEKVVNFILKSFNDLKNNKLTEIIKKHDPKTCSCMPIPAKKAHAFIKELLSWRNEFPFDIYPNKTKNRFFISPKNNILLGDELRIVRKNLPQMDEALKSFNKTTVNHNGVKYLIDANVLHFNHSAIIDTEHLKTITATPKTKQHLFA